MSSSWHDFLMPVLPNLLLVLAIAALAGGGLAHAQGQAAGRTFAPDLCDFALAFPAGGPATTKTLDIGPAFSEVASMQVVGKNYLLRAQCARYVTCKGADVRAAMSHADLKAMAGPLNLDAAQPIVVGFENKPPHGKVGLIQGSSRVSGMEFDMRAAVYYSACSRLSLTFGALKGSGDGWAEWNALRNSVRHR